MTICASCGAAVEVAAKACVSCKGPVLLADRYRLLDVLGRGANGITYRAERTADGRLFAVKELPLRTLEGAKALELFDREARILRELDHPAIPRYEDDFLFGEGKSSALYLVQELVSGCTLDAEMASRRYDVAEVLAIVSELAGVLDYLHRRSPPVIHRDVKPKNVMRRDDGSLVLIDFGSVRDALSAGGGSTVAGTFGYMAPEQLAGKATPASDVYGLGALAVALLTRKEPDELLADDQRLDVRQHVDAADDVLELLASMLEPSPSKRIQHARAVKERAESIAAAASSRPGREPSVMPSPGSEKEARQSEADEPSPRRRSPAVRRATSPVAASRRSTGRTLLWVAAAALVSVVVFLGFGYRASSSTAALAAREVGVPELYARPVVADVNGDGVEDAILVTGIDRGPDRTEDGEDTWGKDNGRFEAFVQAIDGKDGKVLWSVDTGPAYTSGGNDAKSSARVVLLASKDRVGIARILPAGPSRLTIHELATGKELKSLTFEHATGAVCENRGGPRSPRGTFHFARPGSTSGIVIDLQRGTATAPAPSSCGEVATPNVADVPVDSITDRTPWPERFSPETNLRKGAGPYGGRSIVVLSSGLGFLVVDQRVAQREREPSGPAVAIDDGRAVPSGRANTKIEVVGLDVAAGKTNFERSLASLGFTTQVVDQIEATDEGLVLFFSGSDGLALLDAEHGDKKWSLGLPKGHRLSRYTLSNKRAYLHVFGPDPTTFGTLSKKLGSRVLIVDLATGKYVRSLPDGPLDPEPSPPTRSQAPG